MLITSQSERLKPRTVTGKVYGLLKADIINGVYPPGTHLVRRTLAKKYGVSPLPIMEAFFRLENDGLVENTPSLGCHVVDINEEIIAEENKFREALECHAARLFATAATELEKQQVKTLADFLDSVQEKLSSGDQEGIELFHKHHSEYHLAVTRFSGARLIYQQIRKPWFRRAMYAGNTHAVLFPVPSGWHAMLTEALASGDADKAGEAMRKHLRYRLDKYDDSVQEVLRSGGSKLIDRMLEK